MKHRRSSVFVAAALWLAPAATLAYPGGTPDYQTDVAPYCASCHSSRSADALAGAGERAEKEVAERKHIAQILAGEKGYASLSEADRRTLAEQIRALDVASSVALSAPDTVKAGQTFAVSVSVTGPAPPQIVGPDGQPQVDWLAKRPESLDRKLSFVNITGISSDSAAKQWASARVTFTLRAPALPGIYPLSAVYLYGTEKSSLLGYTTNAVGWKEVRGGLGGGSGRVLFAPVKQVVVE